MSKSDVIQVLALTPSEYQMRHKHLDATITFMAHYPKAKQCRCGEKIANDQAWAEHMADVFYPVPAEWLTWT